MHLSIPGNILLLGEYAVLEEGGCGVAMAVQRRVHVTARPAASLVIRGSWPGGSFTWTRQAPAASRLVTAAVTAVEETFHAPLPGSEIDIDSAELFDLSGRKLGLGSSAACAAGLVAALVASRGERPGAEDDALVALRAHRDAQDGRGSGYDVLCSWHGGVGLFRGGRTPQWTPRALPQGLAVSFIAGGPPVSTAEAVQRYAAWKLANPAAARQFLEQSNRDVRSFVESRFPAEAAAAWARCRALGLWLGDAIGVPARVTSPAAVNLALCKAVGAGNELGACLHPISDGPVQGLLHFPVSAGGLAWEETGS